MDGATRKSTKNELIGFVVSAITAVAWVSGGVGIQGLQQKIPNFQLYLIRLSGTVPSEKWDKWDHNSSIWEIKSTFKTDREIVLTEKC